MSRQAATPAATLSAVEAIAHDDALESPGHAFAGSVHSGVRRYLSAFLELPFQAERSSERLLAAIELVRKLNREHARNLPPDAPR